MYRPFKAAVLAASLLIAVQFTVAQSLTADEIIAKNLDSVAPKSVREQLKTLFVGGVSEFTSLTPVVKGAGKAVVISDPDNLYFLMSLNSREYPFEKIGMFGDKVSLPFTTVGDRSLLGKFLNEHSRVLSRNLFCGVMSMRWLVRLPKDAEIKFKNGGLKKLNGKPVYLVDAFIPGVGSGEFTIKLYFDSKTFQHVRSEYERDVPIGQVGFGKQNQLADSTISLIEEFSDFKTVEGLTFPYNYKVTFRSNSTSQVYENSWQIHIANYFINQKLAPDFFTFDLKEEKP